MMIHNARRESHTGDTAKLLRKTRTYKRKKLRNELWNLSPLADNMFQNDDRYGTVGVKYLGPFHVATYLPIPSTSDCKS